MLAAYARRAAVGEVRRAVEEVWARHAGEDGCVAASDLGEVLKELDYNRRKLTLGRGMRVTEMEVAALPSDTLFALRELGVDAPAERSGARLSRDTFMPWFLTKTVGDAGGRRNRLLVKPVTGRVKESSYSLPASGFVYGAPSRKEGATMTALLGGRYAPDGGAPPVPPPAAVDAVLAATAVKGLAPAPVFGAPSTKGDDIRDLLKGAHAPPGGADEHAYPRHLPARGVGGMPTPRPTVTSTLRAAKTEGAVASRVEEAVTGRPAGASEWKMARFTAVPARVPVDGKPLHHPRT